MSNCFINREDWNRKSNLAQFQEDERITLFQRVAQARIDQVKDLEMKAHYSEYDQFLAWKAQEAIPAITATPAITARANTSPIDKTIAHPNTHIVSTYLD